MDYFHITVKFPKPDRNWLPAFLVLGCVLLVAETYRSNKQYQTLSHIHELGGNVFYNHDTPIDIREHVGDDFMSHVVAIDFAFTDLSDADLQQITADLQALPRLSWIRFSASQVTQQAVDALKDKLAGVKIYNTDLSATSQKVSPQFTQHNRSVIPMSWGEKPI